MRTHLSVSKHGENVFAIITSFLAISSIFQNLAKTKEFKEDEEKLFVLLSVLHSAKGRRKHSISIAIFPPRERVFCVFRVNRNPSILFILLSGAE